MAVCKKVIYSGRVQGVGFRYTVRRLAAGLAVAGYVKNLADGNVELMVEGEPGQVDELLARIAQRMAGYLAGTQIHEEPPQGFQEFAVAY